MTTLADDECRCLGLLPTVAGNTQPCTRRNYCARYLQRAHGGAQTPVSQWLCPGMADYWEHYIEVQPT